MNRKSLSGPHPVHQRPLTNGLIGAQETKWHRSATPWTCGRCLPLLAAAALVACGSPTRPTDSPAFLFTGTVTSGNQPFHHFTPASGGDLTAAIVWANPQANQTVCAGRSDIADLPATCANTVGGITNAVTVRVRAGDRYVIYAVPDRSADAAYTIEGRIR